MTWAEYASHVERLGAALARRGIGRGARVAILAPTSFEWDCVQLAALRAGACVAGIDTNYPDGVLNTVLSSISPTALFAWDDSVLARVPRSVTDQLSLVVLLGPQSSGAGSRAVLLRELDQREPGSPAQSPESSHHRPDDPALIVFSSGTTGTPKPMVYTHGQVSLAIESILDAFPDIGEGSVLVCWLPLANLFQRMINFCAIARGATSYVVSDPRTVMEVVPEANPHLLIGVPRFFERLHAGVEARLASSPLARAAARWALRVAKRVHAARRSARAPGRLDSLLLPILDRLVLSRLRGIFGSNLRYFVSGSAPMPRWLLEWFEAIGLPVLEAYGISENIIPIAMNRLDSRRLGTVGKPVGPNLVEVAADGEILVRSPGLGRACLPEDGGRISAPHIDRVLTTGDYGLIDGEGFLQVTGRKGEVFKGAGGVWIAPAEVEGRLRRIPCVEHAVVVNVDGKAIVAILGIDEGVLRGDGSNATGGGSIPAGTPLSSEEQQRLVRDVTATLDGLPSHQRPSALVATLHAFSIAGGELTTNLKLRRKFVEDEFRDAVRSAAAAAEERRLRRAASAKNAANDPILVQA